MRVVDLLEKIKIEHNQSDPTDSVRTRDRTKSPLVDRPRAQQAREIIMAGIKRLVGVLETLGHYLTSDVPGPNLRWGSCHYSNDRQ